MGIRIVVASALIVAVGACTSAPPPPGPAEVRPAVPSDPRSGVLSGPASANPPIAPGLVPWHAGFEEACAAAKASGRPVLLFDMLGRLDREHC